MNRIAIGNINAILEAAKQDDDVKALLERMITEPGIKVVQNGDPTADELYFGDHNFVVHTVTALRQFDYDQVVEYINFDVAGCTHNNPIAHYRDTKGETYRELFPPKFFALLDYYEQHNWNFILFGFDN